MSAARGGAAAVPATPVPDAAAAAAGLTGSEARAVRALLGRSPTPVEWGIFGVMWSEHCSYKHSKESLRRLPTSGAAVLEGPGENAGVVALDDETAIVFKVESHNHPSAVEPFHGAATGVGGILRDVFAMGARPVLLLDSLHFGAPPEDPAVLRVLRGVVEGISAYGNCIGVPTAAGETLFAPCYRANPLVNVMAVGVARRDRLVRARARAGRALLYYGAATGRDGLRGAAFASETFATGGEDLRGAIQIGDPFTGKRILEATLDLVAAGVVEAVQDMGAAGLTSSSVEMAARGGCGVRLDLDRVPRRAAGMTAEEMMLSESQERMLAVVKNGRWEEAAAVLRRHGLEAHRIGETTGDGRLVVVEGGAVRADLPAAVVAGGVPLRAPVSAPPAGLEARRRIDLGRVPDAADPGTALLYLLAAPAFASRAPILERFDHQVGTSTVIRTVGGDAVVLRVDGARRAIALAIDSQARAASLDPRRGAALAVAEAARNVACAGAAPEAVTNCLNFADPERPEVFWALEESIDGMAEACRALGLPVTGGNVSLYNETDGGDDIGAGDGAGIDPTVVVGMLGILESADRALGIAPPTAEADSARLLLLGSSNAPPALDASCYLDLAHDLRAGRPAAPNFAHEAALHALLDEAGRLRRLLSAHDVSDGGLAVALAEISAAAGTGLRIASPDGALGRADAALFGEVPGRVLVAVRPRDEAAVRALAAARGVALLAAGTLGGARFRIDPWIDLAAADVAAAGRETLRRLLGERGGMTGEAAA